jgi:mono/diheme cytochrome c family protein
MENIFINNGCLHCHGMGKDITNFEFDSDKLTFSFLSGKLKKENHFTVPYIVRKGTYAVGGRRQYMPQYPIQKISDNQLFDLMGYIKSKSGK